MITDYGSLLLLVITFLVFQDPTFTIIASTTTAGSNALMADILAGAMLPSNLTTFDGAPKTLEILPTMSPINGPSDLLGSDLLVFATCEVGLQALKLADVVGGAVSGLGRALVCIKDFSIVVAIEVWKFLVDFVMVPYFEMEGLVMDMYGLGYDCVKLVLYIYNYYYVSDIVMSLYLMAFYLKFLEVYSICFGWDWSWYWTITFDPYRYSHIPACYYYNNQCPYDEHGRVLALGHYTLPEGWVQCHDLGWLYDPFMSNCARRQWEWEGKLCLIWRKEEWIRRYENCFVEEYRTLLFYDWY